MMKHFWALPAFLRLVLASQHILDDLLAFPQYEVIISNDVVSEGYAESRLAYSVSRATRSLATGSQETQSYSSTNRRRNDAAGSEDGANEFEEASETYEAVVMDGQRYLCSIPLVMTPQNDTSGTIHSREEEEKELMRATDRGWELLKGMQGNCIYFVSGWWSYSFCYQEGVKQFHQLPPSRGVPMYPPVEDTSVQSYILGTYGEKSEKGKGKEEDRPRKEERGSELAKLETKGETRYLVQKLGGGTTCDLTGKERKIEVQFHCHPTSNDRIGMIKEVATCSYLMVIYTPRLCHDVAFLPPQENKPHTIACQPVVAASDVEAWKARTLAENEELIISQSDSSVQRPVVGGIEVGAQKLVGSEGKQIEKSVVVGGGKETFLAVLATHEGNSLSVEELKELQADPRDVEKLRGEMDKRAKGKGWKLELVETPRGREYRGIIEQPMDSDKDSKKEDRKTENGGEVKDGGAQDEGSEETYKEEL